MATKDTGSEATMCRGLECLGCLGCMKNETANSEKIKQVNFLEKEDNTTSKESTHKVSTISKGWNMEMIPPKRELKDGTTCNLYSLMVETKKEDIGKDFIMKLYGNTWNGSISKGLQRVGLACKDNNLSNIESAAAEVISSLKHGTFFFFTKEGGKLYDADFQIRNDVDGMHDKLRQLFSDAFLSTFSSFYSVHDVHEANSFKSATIGGIKNILMAVGGIIGELSSGFRVNPGEIGNLIGECLSSLTETTDLHLNRTHNGDIGVVELNADGTTRHLGMITYKFQFTVHHFKDKKIEEKKCNYTIKQKSAIFSNPSTIVEVFNRVQTTAANRSCPIV